MRKAPVLKHLERTQLENREVKHAEEAMSASTEFSDSKYFLIFK